eukprot:CAMPEP_0168556906 /NCGR_PEP_ID=MMETSP0413-20121227/9136_1 /TAXON_ID=136452 /ORGANISM="Filamoeba nolandi, Strain NC-AS-23-1" /LENGTH=618 /DNA_ID=CAMNT_0008587891 /DNA_START=132 /DNA_END=1984 /DNA_ORIENTATION=+
MSRNPSVNPSPITSPQTPNLRDSASSPTPASSTGSANLSNAVIDLSSIKEQARKRLVDILNNVKGKKGLVLDPKLSGPLGLIAEVSLLRENGVEKIYHLAPGKLQTESRSVMYFVRPRVQSMKQIAEHIQNHASTNQKKEYHVVFVPKRTIICERVLEEEGVYGDITFGDYPLDLIPFEDDLLSLELETSFKECFLEGDRTSLFYVARSLMRLQSIFGIIPNLKAKGSCSKLVVDMMLRMRKEMGLGMDNNDHTMQSTPEISQLILIDREADLITPLCTQLTYEGLIDEILSINNGFVEVDNEVVGAAKERGKKLKFPLNCNDKFYSSLRDLNFSVIAPILAGKAKEIDEIYKARHDQQTVSQIRDYMKKFTVAQHEEASLKIHAGIASFIQSRTKEQDFHRHLEAEQTMLAGVDGSQDYIEDCIAKRDPLVKVLRLLALLSQTSGGIKQKQLEFFKREILQTYGYEHLFTLNNMEELGLIRKQEGKNNFSILRKNLNLIVDDVDENAPSDFAYVYSGYAPLSIRLIQNAFKPGGWRAREEIIKIIPGPTVEEIQMLPGGIHERAPTTGKNAVTLVFFIGGVTFTELSAIRWLTQQEGAYGDIIVATTKLINGNSFIS